MAQAHGKKRCCMAHRAKKEARGRLLRDQTLWPRVAALTTATQYTGTQSRVLCLLCLGLWRWVGAVGRERERVGQT